MTFDNNMWFMLIDYPIKNIDKEVGTCIGGQKNMEIFMNY